MQLPPLRSRLSELSHWSYDLIWIGRSNGGRFCVRNGVVTSQGASIPETAPHSAPRAGFQFTIRAPVNSATCGTPEWRMHRADQSSLSSEEL
jgi:hypothetical protein